MEAWSFRKSELPMLDITVDHRHRFESWKTQWESYSSLSGLSNQTANIQVQALVLCMTRDTLTFVKSSLDLSEEDMKNPDKIIDALESKLKDGPPKSTQIAIDMGNGHGQCATPPSYAQLYPSTMLKALDKKFIGHWPLVKVSLLFTTMLMILLGSTGPGRFGFFSQMSIAFCAITFMGLSQEKTPVLDALSALTGSLFYLICSITFDGQGLGSIVQWISVMTSLGYFLEALLARPSLPALKTFNMRNLLKMPHVLKVPILGLTLAFGVLDFCRGGFYEGFFPDFLSGLCLVTVLRVISISFNEKAVFFDATIIPFGIGLPLAFALINGPLAFHLRNGYIRHVPQMTLIRVILAAIISTLFLIDGILQFKKCCSNKHRDEDKEPLQANEEIQPCDPEACSSLTPPSQTVLLPK